VHFAVARSVRLGPASQDDFRLTFDSDALQDGLMDVRQLAPALLAAGELIAGAKRFVNGDGATAGLRVKSNIRKSSFDIRLQLLAHLQRIYQEQPSCSVLYRTKSR
jgi:hypothetical protein